MLKRYIILALTTAVTLALSSPAGAAVVNNDRTCTVANSSDSYSSFHSLRHKIGGYTAGTGCSNVIYFNDDGNFTINAGSLYEIKTAGDTDTLPNGYKLDITGEFAESVVIDARESDDDCVFDLRTSNIKFTEITIMCRRDQAAFCKGEGVTRINTDTVTLGGDCGRYEPLGEEDGGGDDGGGDDGGDGDRDGDGVNDSVDRCPDDPGRIRPDGCPIIRLPNPCMDVDDDGICWADDDCPREAGPAKNNGCPVCTADTDHDDICDDVDDCIDADYDSVCDDVDNCLSVEGTVENNGCPEEEFVCTLSSEIRSGTLYIRWLVEGTAEREDIEGNIFEDDLLFTEAIPPLSGSRVINPESETTYRGRFENATGETAECETTVQPYSPSPGISPDPTETDDDGTHEQLVRGTGGCVLNVVPASGGNGLTLLMMLIPVAIFLNRRGQSLGS